MRNTINVVSCVAIVVLFLYGAVSVGMASLDGDNEFRGALLFFYVLMGFAAFALGAGTATVVGDLNEWRRTILLCIVFAYVVAFLDRDRGWLLVSSSPGVRTLPRWAVLLGLPERVLRFEGAPLPFWGDVVLYIGTFVILAVGCLVPAGFVWLAKKYHRYIYG